MELFREDFRTFDGAGIMLASSEHSWLTEKEDRMSHYASAAALFWHRIRSELGRPHLPRVMIELEYDGVLPLRDARGLRVVCLDGVVWITEQEHRKDIVLEAGGAYELSKNGTSLVLALRPARIAMEGPAMAYGPSALARLIASAQALWARPDIATNQSFIRSSRWRS